jgi:predicted Zn-dependent protease
MKRTTQLPPAYATIALGRVLLLMMVLATLAGCGISREQEIRIGQQVHPQFEQEFGGLYPDEQVQQYVESVGMEMARYAGRPQLPWQFRVLNSDQINAFAVPGGFIYITRGLLFRLENEAQLAGILGHEAGHIAHRHSVRQLERAQAIQLGALGAGLIFGADIGDVAGIVGGLVMLRYGRDQEREADMSGLRYMVQGGYNPMGIVQTMQILGAAAPDRGGPEFLASHPSPENRIGYLEETIQTRYAPAREGGRVGERDFEERVLRRGRFTLAPIGPDHPVHWCLTCTDERLAAASIPPQQELLRDD